MPDRFRAHGNSPGSDPTRRNVQRKVEVTMVSNPELVLTSGPQPGRRFPLNEPALVVGRDPRNSIVIDHPQVSRRHARIVRRGNDWVILDLESTNGTFANGRRLVGPHALMTGDVIGLGEAVTLSFQEAEPTAISALAEEPVIAPQPPPPSPARQRAPARRPTSFDEDGQTASPPYRSAPRAPTGQPSREQPWLWIGVGCVVLLLIATCAAALILGYLELLPDALYEFLRGLGLM